MYTIDNKLQTAKVKIFYIIMLTLFLALGAYYLFEPNVPMTRKIILGVLALLAISYGFMLFLRLNYFFLQDSGDFILVRFYTAHPFLRKYKAFKFPASTLKSYEINSSFFNLKHEIVIKAENNKGQFVFPKLSISLLSSADREELKQILDKHL